MSLFSRKEKRIAGAKEAAAAQLAKVELGGQRQREMEKNAQNQLIKFDKHFNDPQTVVALDKMTTSKNGNTKRRYTVSRNGNVKYEAVFVEKNGKQKLEQIVGIRRSESKAPAIKGAKK